MLGSKPEPIEPMTRNALASRAKLASIPENPVDATDCHAVFVLTEFGDTSSVHNLIKCLRMSEDDLDFLYRDSLIVMTIFW